MITIVESRGIHPHQDRRSLYDVVQDNLQALHDELDVLPQYKAAGNIVANLIERLGSPKYAQNHIDTQIEHFQKGILKHLDEITSESKASKRMIEISINRAIGNIKEAIGIGERMLQGIEHSKPHAEHKSEHTYEHTARDYYLEGMSREERAYMDRMRAEDDAEVSLEDSEDMLAHFDNNLLEPLLSGSEKPSTVEVIATVIGEGIADGIIEASDSLISYYGIRPKDIEQLASFGSAPNRQHSARKQDSSTSFDLLRNVGVSLFGKKPSKELRENLLSDDERSSDETKKGGSPTSHGKHGHSK